MLEFASKKSEKVFEIDDDFIERIWDETSLDKAKEMLKIKFMSNQNEMQSLLKNVIGKYSSKNLYTNDLQEALKKIKLKLFQKIKRERQLEEEIKLLQNQEENTKLTRPNKKRKSTSVLSKAPQIKPVLKLVSKQNNPVILPASLGSRKPTEAKEFQLGKKVVLFKKDESKPATKIFEKVVQQKLKVKVTVTKKSLAKQLSTIIADYRTQIKESNSMRTQNLYLFLYDYFTTKHGLKGVAERKYIQLLVACERHKDNPHINLFARFLGIFDALTIEDFKFYIEILDALYGNKLGSDVINDIEEQIPTVKCIDTLYSLFYSRLEEGELNNIKLELLGMAKPCPRSIYPAGIIERVDFILFMIKKFQDFLSLRRNYVEDLFNAADLNGDGYLQFEEFDLVYRNIEFANYNYVSSKTFFETYSDLIADEGDRNSIAISYYRFSILSLEKSLFFIQLQEQLMNVTHEKGINGHIEELRENADFVTENMIWRLRKCNMLSETFEGIITTLNSKLKETDKPRPVYMAYRLMEEETKRLLIQKNLKILVPSIVNICDTANRIFLNKFNKFEDSFDPENSRQESRKDYTNKSDLMNIESEDEWEVDV